MAQQQQVTRRVDVTLGLNALEIDVKDLTTDMVYSVSMVSEDFVQCGFKKEVAADLSLIKKVIENAQKNEVGYRLDVPIKGDNALMYICKDDALMPLKWGPMTLMPQSNPVKNQMFELKQQIEALQQENNEIKINMDKVQKKNEELQKTMENLKKEMENSSKHVEHPLKLHAHWKDMPGRFGDPATWSKDKNGLVRLHGVVVPNKGPVSGLIATLPEEAHPKRFVHFNVPDSTGNIINLCIFTHGSSNGKSGDIKFNAVNGKYGQYHGSNADQYISLNGLQWYAR